MQAASQGKWFIADGNDNIFYSSAILFLPLMSPEGLTVYFFLFVKVERMPRKFRFMCRWHYYCNYGSVQMGLISFFTISFLPLPSFPSPYSATWGITRGRGWNLHPRNGTCHQRSPNGFHMSRCDFFFFFLEGFKNMPEYRMLCTNPK